MIFQRFLQEHESRPSELRTCLISKHALEARDVPEKFAGESFSLLLILLLVLQDNKLETPSVPSLEDNCLMDDILSLEKGMGSNLSICVCSPVVQFPSCTGKQLAVTPLHCRNWGEFLWLLIFQRVTNKWSIPLTQKPCVLLSG